MKKLILNIFLTAAIFLGMMLATGVMQKQLLPVLKLKKELKEKATTGQGGAIRDTLAVEEPSPPDSISRKLKELDAQREEMAKRLAALRKREKEVAQREQKVEGELAQLKSLKEALNLTANTQASKLAKAFQAMDAGQAAKIAQDLDDHTLTELLLQIRERNAAKILASLDPSRAAHIYKQLSSRNLQAANEH